MFHKSEHSRTRIKACIARLRRAATWPSSYDYELSSKSMATYCSKNGLNYSHPKAPQRKLINDRYQPASRIANRHTKGSMHKLRQRCLAEGKQANTDASHTGVYRRLCVCFVHLYIRNLCVLFCVSIEHFLFLFCTRTSYVYSNSYWNL
jgi:hypothetical protein